MLFKAIWRSVSENEPDFCRPAGLEGRALMNDKEDRKKQ